eukprot:2083213-Rhodomonas_salina.1
MGGRGVEESNKTVAACVALQVVRCQYAIQDNENIEHVAAYYSTNWIQSGPLPTAMHDTHQHLSRTQCHRCRFISTIFAILLCQFGQWHCGLNPSSSDEVGRRRIWAMNPGLVDPDGILERGQVITFGHVHNVGQGELLDWLARYAISMHLVATHWMGTGDDDGVEMDADGDGVLRMCILMMPARVALGSCMSVLACPPIARIVCLF